MYDSQLLKTKNQAMFNNYILICKNYVLQVFLEIQENNKATIKRVCEMSINHQLNLCHLQVEDELLEEDKLASTCKSVDKWVNKIWQSSAPMSLVCVVFAGQKNVASGACFLNIKKLDPHGSTETNNSESLGLK